ncbi:glycosyltransferase [Pseudomonas sp. SID14000]|uniref:glycosyltransferase family 2 protein n=1 Tax=Pseudomonas sp. SID14000 TaxID=1986221 RepID=UPI002114EC1B|nr:glycosyltransferase [Pseudomonas sp. SID14000]
MTEPLDLSVLIPAKNEVDNLPSLLMEIRTALAAEHYEVLVVDAGSSDHTLSVLKQLKSQSYAQLRILTSPSHVYHFAWAGSHAALMDCT